MENFLSYSIFVSVILLLNLVEYRRFHTVINPFFFLSVPFSAILIICLLFNRKLSFVEFYPLSINIWSTGLLLFWFGGVICHFLFDKLRLGWVQRACNQGESLYARIKCPRLLDCIFALAAIVSLMMIMRSGAESDFGSKEMGEDVGVGGIAGRIANVILVAIPYYIGYRMNKLKKGILIVLLLLSVIALGSKTWLTYTLLSAMIVLNLNNSRIKLLPVLIGGAILFGAFVIYYKLNTDIDEGMHFSDFVIRHLYFYVTSGILPMSEVVKNNIYFPYTGINHPFITLIKYWLDPMSVHIHSTVWITTDSYLGTQSNVFTYFGSLFFVGGPIDFILYSIITGVTAAIFQQLYLRTHSIFFAITYAFTLSMLFFGWFNFGIGLLRIWEVYIYCIVFYYLSKRVKDISLVEKPTNIQHTRLK